MASIEVENNGIKEKFQKHEVKHIIESRVDELFDLVERELKKVDRSKKLPGGVVITGGTAKLPGLASFAREKLQLASRIGQIQPIHGLIDETNDSAFATAIGLMQLDVLLSPVHAGKLDVRGSSKLLSTVQSLLRNLLTRNKK